MKHTFEAQVIRASRKPHSGPRPWIAYFEWKADGILIESAEYSLPELQRLIAEMPRGEPDYRRYVATLSALRRVTGIGQQEPA